MFIALRSCDMFIGKFDYQTISIGAKKMANTYTQIYLHVIFAVKGRDNLISPTWKEELYKYLTSS